MEPRILLYDIETTPQLQWRWRYWDDGAPIKVVEDTTILCFAYKWLGEDEIRFVNTRTVDKLYELFDEADVIVAHNNDKFDERTANAMFLAAGYGPPSPYQRVDTLKVAKKYFNSTSASLKELARQYGFSNKLENSGAELWFRCMAGDRDAWKEMRAYNEQDVRTLEELYLKVRPWMATGHPNMNAWVDEGALACAKCGSTRVQKRGQRNSSVYIKQTVLCNDCGGYSTIRLGGTASGLTK